MKTVSQAHNAGDCERIARAIACLRENTDAAPPAGTASARAGWSQRRFQQEFRDWVGVSPGRFLEFLTARHVRQLLDDSTSAPDAAPGASRSGLGRPHEEFVAIESVAPGGRRRMQGGMRVDYGIHPSPFGKMFLAVTAGRICALALGAEEQLHKELERVKATWPGARLFHDPAQTAAPAARLFNPRGGQRPAGGTAEFRLLMRGTDFQMRVWRALLKIPPGCVVSYRRLAQFIGNPRAVRAVAAAVAANPIAYLVPCHRVLRASGELGGYRWGLERKKALLAWDAAQAERNRTATG